MKNIEKHAYAMEYLLDNANAIIQYRLITEVQGEEDTERIAALKAEVISSERYSKLVQCLRERKEYHGATLYAVENSLNMLIDMGVYYKKGFDEFDEVLEQISEEAKNKPIDNSHVLGHLSHIVLVPFLLRAGMRDKWLMDFILDRLSIIHEFVSKKQYDIYEDISKYRGMPEAFKNRPVIKEELYKNGKICFPLEHDIYGFAAIYQEAGLGIKGQIDDVIKYIMDECFAMIEDGYGILHKNSNYWAMGWDPKPTDLNKSYKYNPLLLKMELLANFPDAVGSKWFKSAMDKLNQYADENGVYHFPKELLTEKDSCWILGNHMSVGENRRKRNALELEGTFRMMLILN